MNIYKFREKAESLRIPTMYQSTRKMAYFVRSGRLNFCIFLVFFDTLGVFFVKRHLKNERNTIFKIVLGPLAQII